MSSRKRKGSKISLSLYKTKYFKKLKSQTFLESLHSSQNSTLSDNCPEVKTTCVELSNRNPNKYQINAKPNR